MICLQISKSSDGDIYACREDSMLPGLTFPAPLQDQFHLNIDLTSSFRLKLVLRLKLFGYGGAGIASESGCSPALVVQKLEAAACVLPRSLEMAMANTFLVLLLSLGLVHADTSFQYYQFSDSSGSISVLGDARIYIDDLALELTNTSAGRATYDYPVRMLSTTPGTSISFETTFIFSIENDHLLASSLSYGAGLTFSISSENRTVGDPGGFLGLVKANPASSLVAPVTKYFALEFDTHQDPQFQDMNDNHVGVDFNSLISQQAKSAQTGSSPVTLASGNHIQAYVSYNSLEHVLDVSISPYVNNDYIKPNVSLLSVPVDLSGVFNEYMYVGFSAATGAGVVRHKIWSWTFKTTTVNGFGQPVSSPPDADYLAPSPGPDGFDQGRPFGDSGGVKRLAFGGPVMTFLGVVFVSLLITC